MLSNALQDDVAELKLPGKSELLVYASLSPLQEQLYEICVNRAVKALTGEGEKVRHAITKLRKGWRTVLITKPMVGRTGRQPISRFY